MNHGGSEQSLRLINGLPLSLMNSKLLAYIANVHKEDDVKEGNDEAHQIMKRQEEI